MTLKRIINKLRSPPRAVHVAEAEQARCRIVDDQCSVWSVGDICVPSSLVTQDGGIVTQFELIGIVLSFRCNPWLNVQVNVFCEPARPPLSETVVGCRI
jgi:hypothetical protein